MKKTYFIFTLLSIGIFACQKDDLKPNIDDSSNKISNYEESQKRNFKKEIIVYDETNKNHVMIALHADEMNVITSFLERNEMKINTSDPDVEKVLNNSYNKREGFKDEINYNENGSLDKKSELIIEIVKQSFQSNEKHFSLNFVAKEANSNDYNKNSIPILSFEAPSGANAIGSVHLDYGPSYHVYYYQKKNWWNTLWSLKTFGGGSFKFDVYPASVSSPYFDYWDYTSTNPRKVMMEVERQSYDMNFKVFYSLYSSNAYSNVCPLGTYNSNNFGECYYGTVPLGTNAFTYNYGGSMGVWFMYTPLNNTCPWQPEPGSGFDGQNCKVVKIPNSRVGTEYVWQRDLLIKSYLLGEL